MKYLADRSTTDIVVLVFTFVIACALLIAVVGALIVRVVHPNQDMAAVNESITQIVSTIVGALVGFIGGRAQGRYEQARNGD
jgi:hypothetical protein